MITAQAYAEAFALERSHSYPGVDAFELDCGYKIDRDRLEEWARVLACPVKVNPPCWQHGRVLYAAARQFLASEEHHGERHRWLDIGTAKGFSALVMASAIADSRASAEIISLDVISPTDRVKRNSVEELSGLKTVTEFLKPYWPNGIGVEFMGQSSSGWLQRRLLMGSRISFAFVDGRHEYGVVKRDAAILKALQEPGDVIVFDDIQIPGVSKAVVELCFKGYRVRRIYAHTNRRFAVAIKE